MRSRRALAIALALLSAPAVAHVPLAKMAPAIYTDPPHDKAHPPGMEVLHIPSGGVKINGVAYTAAGAGPHPVLVLMHGLPGNEKNLDLPRRSGGRAGRSSLSIIAARGEVPAPFASPAISSIPVPSSLICAIPPMRRGWRSIRSGSSSPAIRWAAGSRRCPDSLSKDWARRRSGKRQTW
jgi:hypothetical protein